MSSVIHPQIAPSITREMHMLAYSLILYKHYNMNMVRIRFKSGMTDMQQTIAAIPDPVEAEITRRCFWVLFVAYQSGACTLDWPNMFDHRDTDCFDLPVYVLLQQLGSNESFSADKRMQHWQARSSPTIALVWLLFRMRDLQA